VTDASRHGFVIDVSQPSDDLCLVALSGELDLSGAPELSQALAAVAETPGRRVVVDLSRLAFMDSMGLRVLITGAKAVESTGGTMTLVGPRPNVQRLFEIVRLAEVISIEPSADRALAN
jgi:anti-sigma B factor antagonist